MSIFNDIMKTPFIVNGQRYDERSMFVLDYINSTSTITKDDDLSINELNEVCRLIGPDIWLKETLNSTQIFTTFENRIYNISTVKTKDEHKIYFIDSSL